MEILLFINDNILINISISNFLTSKGYEVISCTTGEEAIELSDDNNFDLVIVDLNLPNFSISDIINEVRKRCGSVPIIGLTSIDLDIAEEIRKEICLILPDNPKEELLLDAIEECLGKR